MSVHLDRDRPQEKDTGFPFPRRGFIADLVLKLGHEAWSEVGENPAPYLAELISSAKEDVLMICGDLKPPLVEQPALLRVLENKLNRGVQVSIIFDKTGARSAAEAAEAVRRENPGIADLKQRFATRFQLFWTKREPSLDFTVVDSANVYVEVPPVEGESKAPGPPATISRYKDRQLGQFFKSRFEETREKHTEEVS